MSLFAKKKYEVGELRPSQLLFTYGIGSVVDLPNISAMVMGLEDWDITQANEISENRLLQAVKYELGHQVSRLYAPPSTSNQQNGHYFEDETSMVGVPVSPFPRWMVCPRCRILAPLESELFQIKTERNRPDKTRYVHINCSKGATTPVVPARFLVACEAGHLDDFPWRTFVHRGPTDCTKPLKLKETSVTGEASSIEVECEACEKKRRMSEAFGVEGRNNLPGCTGRRPHLRDYEELACEEKLRTISLGASNNWFPVVLSSLSVPVTNDKLGQLIEDHWNVLQNCTSVEVVKAFRGANMLPFFTGFSDQDIWERVDLKKKGNDQEEQIPPASLKEPEWRVLTNSKQVSATDDFKASPVAPPVDYEHLIRQTVLVERLREVRAVTGFTRIESPSDYAEEGEVPENRRVALSRKKPIWVPATQVRGEGIFLEFNEQAIQKWLEKELCQKHNKAFFEAHQRWREARHLPDLQAGYPDLRYILLHSLSHALMRQLALECGYAAASIRERIYSLPPESEHGPMAGILLYTAAPDSEGTLGGLVSLGSPEELGRHLDGALDAMRLCASDPLCAEHTGTQEKSLHWAACHACLFAPETSCERGNKYLDRTVLVPTVVVDDLAFFSEK